MARKRAKDRMTNEINAGSMADIAFLLLIFFLVTTTIDIDSGITVKLPPWSEEEPDITQLNARNVFAVLVNANNDLLVRGERAEPRELRERTKEFIMNPQQRTDLAESPENAIISLKNDRGTKYGTYITVYNELKAAYDELWDEEAQKRYGLSYEDLDAEKQKDVRTRIPFVISEAETSFGEE